MIDDVDSGDNDDGVDGALPLDFLIGNSSQSEKNQD